jgi:hypothetical protein
MLNPKFIRCRNCDAVHRVTAFDNAPNYSVSAGVTNEVVANDWHDFMARHAGHRLEPLEATGQSYFPDGRSSDPMAAGYIEATDGKGTFLLRRFRLSIQEPLRYELVPGRLAHRESTFDIQESALRKEMKLHFLWAPAEPLSDPKIDLFVQLYRQVVSGLDAGSIYGCEFIAVDDNFVYRQLDAAAWSALLENCRNCFTTDELAALRRFIDCHRGTDDVLAVVVQRGIAVEQRA